MAFKQNLAIFLLIILGCQNLKCTYSLTLENILFGASLFAAGSASVIIWHYRPFLYEMIQSKINEKIECEIADDVVLLNTPNSTIRSFSSPEREKKFKKKAWLLERKKKISDKLEEIADSSTVSLSSEHKKNIKALVDKINFYVDQLNVQNLFPMFSQDNPYEAYYQNPSFIDQIIDDKIAQLLVSSAKPLAEQSPEEQAQPNRLSIKHILCRMITDVGDIAYKKMEQAKAAIVP